MVETSVQSADTVKFATENVVILQALTPSSDTNTNLVVDMLQLEEENATDARCLLRTTFCIFKEL